MPAIQGNRAIAHINPVQCASGADAAAAALSVRERRRSFFFVAEPPRIAEAPRPVKAEEPKVVPPVEITIAEMFGSSEDIGQRLPRLEEIKVAVCNFYRVRAIDLLSARRTKDIAFPRQVAMWLGRRVTLQSFPAIGRYFGGRDHSTAVHAVAKIDRLIGDGDRVTQHVVSIAEALREKGFEVDLGIGAVA